jgi:hypothetical protein
MTDPYQIIANCQGLISRWRVSARTLSSSHPAWSSHLYDCANDLEAALSSDAAKAAPPGLPEDSQVRPLLGKRVRVRLDDNGAEIITVLSVEEVL